MNTAFRPTRLFATLLLVSLVTLPQATFAAKNVIIMISDGAGYNTWLATSMYRGKVGKETYDSADWVHISTSNYPLNRSITPTGDDQQDPVVVYDPAKAWNTKTEGDGEGAFAAAGYQFMLNTFTDSAASATVMATGIKTYNNAINFDNRGKPLTGKTLAEIAKKTGRSVGQITTVPWSHATPAGFGGAHNISRNNYPEIANEMLRTGESISVLISLREMPFISRSEMSTLRRNPTLIVLPVLNAPYLDLLMGAGHPDFDDNGKPHKPAAIDYQYVGGNPIRMLHFCQSASIVGKLSRAAR